jgi:DNA-binding protein HU-beta
MNKSDLVDIVASQLGETKAAASRAVEAVLFGIAHGVRDHERVTIVGFGSFERKQRAGRSGVNPVTKERIEIKPTITVGFKPAQALKDSLAHERLHA